jgi:hypothetical protein
VLVALVVLASVTAGAFKLDYHDTITREALAQVGRIAQVPQPGRADMLPARFTDIAIGEIVLANKAADLEDCGESTNELVVAKPCTDLGETIEGFQRVLKGIEEEHFDGEKIPGGSNRVFNARITIRDQIQRSKFVGARKALGRALHAIQDFYAHTNWIHVAPAEVRWSGYESRIGQLGAFADGTGRPRMARPNEPQCLKGYALLTELPQGETDELVRRYVNAEARGDNTGLVTRDGDLGEIIDTGKCRHEWAISLVRHEGIDKDEPGRSGYGEARAAALRHTTQFKDGFTDMINGR